MLGSERADGGCASGRAGVCRGPDLFEPSFVGSLGEKSQSTVGYNILLPGLPTSNLTSFTIDSWR